jgi:hypothetical protein
MSVVCCDGIQAAKDSLATHGFCVISLADHLNYAQVDAALTNLGVWCTQCNEYMDNHCEWLTRSGRDDDAADFQKRYSMNDWNNWKYDAWLQIVDLLQPLFEVLICESACIKTLGGDTVRAHAHSDQHIHADGWSERPASAADLSTPEWLVASVAVHDIVIPPALEHDFIICVLVFPMCLLCVCFVFSGCNSTSEILMGMPPWENASLGKCIPGKMHLSENASLGKCLTGKMHPRENASLGKCITGKIPPWENASLGKCILIFSFGSKSYR